MEGCNSNVSKIKNKKQKTKKEATKFLFIAFSSFLNKTKACSSRPRWLGLILKIWSAQIEPGLDFVRPGRSHMWHTLSHPRNIPHSNHVLVHHYFRWHFSHHNFLKRLKYLIKLYKSYFNS